MSQICPHCGANAVQVDEEGKLEVCSECGAVVNEGSFQNDRGAGASSYNPSAFQSQPQRENWRKQKWYESLTSTTSYRMNKRIRAQTERLRLPKEYCTQVFEIIKNIYRANSRKVEVKKIPKSKNAVVASCIYIVCRRNGVVIGQRNVAEAADCDVAVVAKCTQVIQRFFHFEFQDPLPEELIDTILSQFGIRDVNVKKLAIQFHQFCTDTLITMSKNKVLAMLGMVRICIESTTGFKMNAAKFKEVCTLHSCTPLAVSKNFTPVKKELLKFAEHVPWISTVKTSTLHKCLKEILSFYDQCKDHRNVDFKYSWEEKREEIDAGKRKLITEAQKRIEICQKQCKKSVSLSDDTILHKKCELCSDVSSSSTTQETPAQNEALSREVQISSDHVCCPHCCIKATNCPNYQRNGTCDFCMLEHNAILIEYLLRKGYSEAQIMNGNLKSIFCGDYYQSDSDGEREDLDDKDIPEDEIHNYIKSESEKEQAQLFLEYNKDCAKEDK